MTQELKWAAQLLVLWGQVQWGTPWWQQRAVDLVAESEPVLLDLAEG
jgi:hypothetical protein